MPSVIPVSLPTPGADDPEHIALLLRGCSISAQLRAAVEERDQREDLGLGDTEDGQHLRYPQSPSLDPALLDSPLTSAPSSPEQQASAPSFDIPPLILDGPARPPTTSAPLNHKKRSKSAKAAKLRAAVRPSAKKIRSSLSRNHRKHPGVLLEDFRMLELKTAARGAWIALRTSVCKRYSSLEEVVSEGLRVVRWDGQTPTLLIDEDREVCSVLGGFPGLPEVWKGVRAEANDAVAEAGKSLRFSKHGDRRGPFRTIAVGVSYGGGQKRPGKLRHSRHNERVLARLMANPAIKRIAGFASSVFAFFAPKMYRDYATKLDALFEHYPELDYNWNNSVFPAASFNFGPNSASYEHNDHGNRAAGWCSIYCDGSFDPRYGGHLILRQFGIVVEFPPGSTVLIPSACITHGNIPVREGETRWSFAQYASGGLFRYVEYGLRSWANLSKSEKEKWAERRATRWVEELSLLSRVEDLARDQCTAGLLA